MQVIDFGLWLMMPDLINPWTVSTEWEFSEKLMLMIMLTGTLSYTNVRTSSSLYSIMKENNSAYFGFAV